MSQRPGNDLATTFTHQTWRAARRATPRHAAASAPSRAARWALLLILMTSPLAATGCASASTRSSGETEDRPRFDGNVVYFSEAFAHRIGLESTEVRAGKLPLEVSGMGTVSSAERQSAEELQVSAGTNPRHALPGDRHALKGELFLPANTATLVHPGDPAEVSGATDRSLTFEARVTDVSQPVGELPSRASVQVRIDNASSLRLGQAIHVVIHASAGGSDPGHIVPTEAVTFVAGSSSVFVLEAPGTARIARIEPWFDNGHEVQLKGGLQANERVVTTGVFELKSELFR